MSEPVRSRADDAPDHGREVALILERFTPYRVVRLGRLLSERLADAYAGENLTIPEWRVLAVVAQADHVAARDVAARTPMDKMAVSRAVASLKAKGLVAAATSEADRRVAALALTPAGRATFGRVAEIAVRYEMRLLEGLSDGERETFGRVLDRLAARAGEA